MKQRQRMHHTTMNWNVNVLLDDLRYDVRHFHQFTTHLRHCDIEKQLKAAATVLLFPFLPQKQLKAAATVLLFPFLPQKQLKAAATVLLFPFLPQREVSAGQQARPRPRPS